MRGALPRTVIAFGIGIVVLAAILFYASTVDSRPPTVTRIALTQHDPADPNLALTTSSIEVDFSEPVEPASAETAFVIEPAVSGSFSWSGTTLTFSPDQRLPLETAFRVHVRAGVRDRSGNAMASASDPLAFQTVGHPAVVATDPPDGADGVAQDAVIQITFSTLMDTASVESALTLTPGTDVTLRWSGEQLTVEPDAPLREATRYTLRIGSDARDQAGTPLADQFRLGFTTVRTDLGVTAELPTDGLEGTSPWTPIGVIFDRAIDPASVNGDTFTITPSVAGSVEAVALPGAAGMAGEGRVLVRFEPSGPLDPNTTYEVTLSKEVRADDGARLAEDLEWSFTTGAPQATLSNQIVFLSDRSGVSNLWAMNPDGSVPRQVSAELSPVTEYAVAPDRRSVVVGDGSRLVEMAADGGERKVLTEPGSLEFDAAYAPDGERIVFGRADAETGAGLGLWTRPAAGGDASAVEMPEISGGSPAPTPAASGEASSAPLLRAPRYAPDGSALAFVDGSGRVGVLELSDGRLNLARFVAVTPPTWLPDSSAVLLTGLAGSAGPASAPGGAPGPVSPLEPFSLGLDTDQLAALRIARLERGSSGVQLPGYPPGAAVVARGSSGRLAYATVSGGAETEGGLLWVTNASGGASVPMLRDDGPLIRCIAPGPGAGAFLVERAAGGGVSGNVPGGIWQVNALSGDAIPLAPDGRRPRWLP